LVAKSKTKVVKVKAFPFAAKMTVGANVAEAQILKLTASGFLMEAQMPGLKTGEKFQIAFELPVVQKAISEMCVVVKLYTTVESHVIEGHFHSLPAEEERKIRQFLSRIPKTASSV
jgi:hypothetical protein